MLSYDTICMPAVNIYFDLIQYPITMPKIASDDFFSPEPSYSSSTFLDRIWANFLEVFNVSDEMGDNSTYFNSNEAKAVSRDGTIKAFIVNRDEKQVMIDLQFPDLFWIATKGMVRWSDSSTCLCHLRSIKHVFDDYWDDIPKYILARIIRIINHHNLAC